MEELDRSTVLVDEMAQEVANTEGPSRNQPPDWHNQVALSTLILAILAAIGALLAGMTAHEAVLDRTREAIDSSVLEGERVTVEVLKAKHEILLSLGDTPDAAELAKIQAYQKRVPELRDGVAGEEEATVATGYPHLVLAIAATVISIGIAVTGMSVVVERKWLWLAGLAVSLVGVIALGIGIVTMIS